MKNKLMFRRTTITMIGLAAFLSGLGLARTKTEVPFAAVVLAGFFVLLAARKKRVAILVGVVVFGLFVGLWRGSVVMDQLQPYHQLYDEQVMFTGVAEGDAVYADGGQLSFDASEVKFAGPFAIELPGKISVRGRGAPAIYRGDVIQVSGTLSATRGSRQARISFANLEVVGRSNSLLEKLRLRFAAGMQNALPEPAASFALGLLIGQRTTLPEDFSDQLAMVGLTHIIAVSGYNLTIIIRSVRRKLGGLSKYQQTVLTVILIAAFVLVTGFSASIVRAAIVSGLSLGAWYYGRVIKPLLLILMAAAITGGLNPLYVWSDIGWYLSFLAFFGILIVAPLLRTSIFKHRKNPPELALIVLETTSAQIMTLPLILYIFGEASLVSLLSNIIVVPLIPFVMVMALAAGLAGMFVPILSGWVAWPARVLLTFIINVVRLLSRVPHALVHYQASLAIMISLYAAMAALLSLGWWKVKAKFGTVTDNKPII